jgi:hypothetical protein
LDIKAANYIALPEHFTHFAGANHRRIEQKIGHRHLQKLSLLRALIFRCRPICKRRARYGRGCPKG